jgi:lysophospholipase L1-like esterase
MDFDLHVMTFGDSTATGYGCDSAEQVPGVLVARGLAEQTGKRIRFSTKAIVGATSKGVSGQVDAMFVAGPPPDVAVMMLGANDITALNGISQSARRLALTVRKLRARGAIVVVGTCPDLGVISAIPQPLRSLAHSRGLQLARAQAAAVRSAGGVPVPLAQLLAPQFREKREAMFSADGFHPSPIAYRLAAECLLHAVCDALGLGEPVDKPTPDPQPHASEPVLGARHTRLSVMSRWWRSPERPDSPAPSSPPAAND